MARPKVRVALVGEDGNAFAILGRWTRAAKQQGWSEEERQAVLEQARSGDYDNLLRVIDKHSIDIGMDAPEEDE